MKKFYAIGLLVASTFFATAAKSQCYPATGVNIAEAPGNCKVNILTSVNLVGARIVVFAGTQNITTFQTNIVTGANPRNGYGVAYYNCDQFDNVSRVVIVNGADTCEVDISDNINLPIKLGSFAVSISGSSAAKLDWTTELESNSSLFGIEKSVDGKNFTTVATVPAAGNSNSNLSYSYTDKSFAGTAFYRLRLVDIDGKTEYSAVKYANGGPNASTAFSVFPNPFRSDVQLKGINASDVNKANIRVFSATGKEVSYKVTGSNSIAIDASLPKGVYILRVKDQTYKLVKE